MSQMQVALQLKPAGIVLAEFVVDERGRAPLKEFGDSLLSPLPGTGCPRLKFSCQSLVKCLSVRQGRLGVLICHKR